MKVKRIVTRPDFDGIVCASLLKDIYGKRLPVIWIEPEDIRKKNITIGASDVLANLPFDSRCSLYFDHHITNLPPKDKPGLFALDPSAARLIYRYFKGKFSRDFTSLVKQTDRIDSANLTREEIISPEQNSYLLLAMTLYTAMREEDEEYWNYLVNSLLCHEIEQIMEDDQVKRRCKNFSNQAPLFKRILIENTRIIDNIALTDFREVKPLIFGNRFLIYTIYPEIDINFRIIQSTTNSSEVHFHIAYNIFNTKPKIDIGNMLKKYGGGGHPSAGGITINNGKAEKLIDEIIGIIKQNG